METISIIIPVLNEAGLIQKTLQRIKQTSELVEVIVVDGGSTDNTVKLAEAEGVKVISNLTQGRAKQMNLGAKIAQGDILLFLHGDTLLPQNYPSIVREGLEGAISPKASRCPIAGAFELKIEGESLGLGLVERIVKWRSRFCQLPYGDQGIFLKASVFREIGGFPEIEIMEDFEFMRQLSKRGKINLVNASVITSGRRWHKLGVLRTTLINQLIIIGYFLKIPPSKLKAWYRNWG